MLYTLQQIKILKLIKEEENRSITHISQKTRITFSHTSKLISEMTKLKLVSREKKGRRIIPKITKKGERILKDKIANLDKYMTF